MFAFEEIYPKFLCYKKNPVHGGEAENEIIVLLKPLALNTARRMMAGYRGTSYATQLDIDDCVAQAQLKLLLLIRNIKPKEDANSDEFKNLCIAAARQGMCELLRKVKGNGKVRRPSSVELSDNMAMGLVAQDTGMDEVKAHEAVEHIRNLALESGCTPLQMATINEVMAGVIEGVKPKKTHEALGVNRKAFGIRMHDIRRKLDKHPEAERQ